MQTHRSALRKLVLSAIIVVVPVASAHALDTAAFGDRLKAVLAAQGADIDMEQHHRKRHAGRA